MSSRLALALVFLTCLAASAAEGATVRKVSKDKMKILIQLNQAELAAVDEDEEVVIEVGDDRFVVSCTLAKLNPVKQTVVLVLEAPDRRFTKKQSIRFLSIFWNVALSPLVTTPAQYHQFAHSFGELGAGYTFQQLQTKVEDLKTTTTQSGTRVATEAYLHFDPKWFGASVAFERRDGLIDTRGVDETQHVSANVGINQIRPQVWAFAGEGYRIGLRYDHSMITETRGSGNDALAFDYVIGEPKVAFSDFDKEHEYVVEYKDRGDFMAVDTSTVAGRFVEVKSKRKHPAELRVKMRNVSSPVFVWGLGLGFVFFEREGVPGEPLAPKAGPEELLRLHASFESRLPSGAKLDWMVYYEGAKTAGFVTSERGINVLGGHLSYQRPLLFPGFLVGGAVALEGGLRNVEVDAEAAGVEEDENGEIPATATAKTTGGAASLLAFARFEFDFGGKGARKR